MMTEQEQIDQLYRALYTENGIFDRLERLENKTCDMPNPQNDWFTWREFVDEVAKNSEWEDTSIGMILGVLTAIAEDPNEFDLAHLVWIAEIQNGDECILHEWNHIDPHVDMLIKYLAAKEWGFMASYAAWWLNQILEKSDD